MLNAHDEEVHSWQRKMLSECAWVLNEAGGVCVLRRGGKIRPEMTLER